MVELAAEFGTPAYIYAEDDMRARARAYREAFERRGADFEVLFASKSLPCTAAYRLFAEEGLSVDVASGGELHMALRAGFDPARIHMHGNNKTDEEILFAARSGIGHLILDSFDEIERCERLLDEPQDVLIRVTPGIKPSTHDYVRPASSTRSSASGSRTAWRRGRSSGCSPPTCSSWSGCTPTSARRSSSSSPTRWRSARSASWPATGAGSSTSAAASASPTRPRTSRPRSTPTSTSRCAASPRSSATGVRILVEPGRSLVGNAGVTAYRVGTVKEIPGVRTYVAVDGGMSDNLRPMLYGSRYEALIADRAAAPRPTRWRRSPACTASPATSSSATRCSPSPAVGDVLVTPATGAYGYAMASNYNGVPRPPVVFCRDGEARVVVRRETYEDLTARDV